MSKGQDFDIRERGRTRRRHEQARPSCKGEAGSNDSPVDEVNELALFSQAYGSQFKFLEEGVWVEVLQCLLNQGAALFSPGLPDQLCSNYTETVRFLRLLQSRYCPSPEAAVRLRSHPLSVELSRKWHLPVYFQLRFQELALQLQNSLSLSLTPASTSVTSSSTPRRKSLDMKTAPQLGLEASKTLWFCVHECWREGVWLPELGDRFFKLTLQLFNRYAAWINTGLGLTSGVASSSGVSVKMLISSYLSSLSSSSSASPAVWSSLTGPWVKEKEKEKTAVSTPVPSIPSSSSLLPSLSVPLSALIQLIGDVYSLTQGGDEAPLEVLAVHIAQRFNQGLDVNALDATSSTVSSPSSSPSIPQLVRSALNVCGDKLSQTLPVLFGLCVSRIVSQTSTVLAQGVPRIKATYSLTNRAPPTSHSQYVGEIFSFMRESMSACTLPTQLRLALSFAIVLAATPQFKEKAGEVLKLAADQEASVQRLKKKTQAVQSSASGSNALSAIQALSQGQSIPSHLVPLLTDADKVRIQLYFDIKQYSVQCMELVKSDERKHDSADLHTTQSAEAQSIIQTRPEWANEYFTSVRQELEKLEALILA